MSTATLCPALDICGILPALQHDHSPQARSPRDKTPAMEMDTSTSVQQISSLLHEAAETHHRVFRIVDGADDDWASWYADWLVNLSELPAVTVVDTASPCPLDMPASISGRVPWIS